MSTYPEARIHVRAVRGERPIFILMPSLIHVLSHIRVPSPTALTSFRFLQGLILTPDPCPDQTQGPLRSCFWGTNGLGGRPIDRGL